MSGNAFKVNDKVNAKIAEKLFPSVCFRSLSRAVRGLHATSSSKHGGDCLEIAIVSAAALNQLGIPASIVIGESAWRVDGNSDGAVIGHTAHAVNHVTELTKNTNLPAVPFHAWLKLNEYWELDLSTYQFQMKMEALDAVDGLKTPVSWKPDYLFFNQSQVSSFNAVQQAYSEGIIFYQKDTDNAQKIKDIIKSKQVDLTDDINMLLFIYKQVKEGTLETVVGPEGTVLI